MSVPKQASLVPKWFELANPSTFWTFFAGLIQKWVNYFFSLRMCQICVFQGWGNNTNSPREHDVDSVNVEWSVPWRKDYSNATQIGDSWPLLGLMHKHLQPTNLTAAVALAWHVSIYSPLKSLLLAWKFSGRLALPCAQWLLFSHVFFGIAIQKIRSCRAFSRVVRVTREKNLKTILLSWHISHRQSRMILLESWNVAEKAASSVSMPKQTPCALTLWSYLYKLFK